jgi:two-component system chemotaxis response regulator CheB
VPINNRETVKVLIVDDSPVARMTLNEIFAGDPRFWVVGAVSNGGEALRFLESPENPRPDVVTMDVIMPEMDGFETTRKIMETAPVPIVIITSSYRPDEVKKTFQSMEAGAVTILQKPGSITGREFPGDSGKIREIVKLMAGVKVVRRWPHKEAAEKRKPSFTSSVGTSSIPTGIRVVAVGASTGGPRAVCEILSMLPRELPVPIVMVQHIGGNFMEGMIAWLEKTTGFPVHFANGGQEIQPGHVYLAPDDFHMGVDENHVIQLSRSEPEEGLRPSASFLFRSVARSFGENAVGVLLTGMGRDGAEGLKMMRDAGAPTIVQDESTSVVFGMPAEAIKLGGAQHILPLEDIPAKIQLILGIEPRTSLEKET